MSDWDYPTPEELDMIATWPAEKGWHDLMEFIEDLWWCPEWGFKKSGTRYFLSTGGWSGNEEIIGAMLGNTVFWTTFWESSKTGGHYTFKKQKAPYTKRMRGCNR